MALDLTLPKTGVTTFGGLYTELRANFNGINAMFTLPSWTNVASISGWTLTATVGYTMDAFGNVILEGRATAGATPATTLFTLGSSYRPAAPHARQFPAIAHYDGSPLYLNSRKLVTVNYDGTVVASSPVGGDIVYFSAISFKAGA